MALLGRSLRFLFWPCLDIPFSGLSVGMHRRTGRPRSGQDCPLSMPSPPEQEICTLPVSCSLQGEQMHAWSDPGTKSCLLWSGLLHSVLRIWPLRDRWSVNTLDVREGSEELISFPSSRPTDISLWLNRSMKRFSPPPPPPPDFSGRQLQTCCQTWEQPLLRPYGTSLFRQTRCPSTWSHCTAGGDCCTVNPSAMDNHWSFCCEMAW